MSASKSEPGRRNTRSRHVTQRLAVVDESVRQQAAQARLEALENDNEAPDTLAAESGDEEFVLESDGSDSKPGKRGKKRGKGGVAGKRKLRGTASERRGPKTFQRLLEEAELDRAPGPNYLTASAGPPACTAARKFCSVCGNLSPYTCARCGARFCSRKCYTVHTETRCLKMMA